MSHVYIYQSAAGAGKTHVLVRSYINIALQSLENFQKILAITFTNQATQEMKQRILTSLHTLAEGGEIPLKHELMQLNQWNSNTLQNRSKRVLSQILHNYDHFSVSTIDSFLQSIVRHFAKDLGIQHGFTVEMDQENVLSHIIIEVIQQTREDPSLRQWLVSFAEHRLRAGKPWRFQQVLHQLGYELFTEAFSQQEAELVQATSDSQRLITLVAQLAEDRYSLEEKLQQLATQAMSNIEAAGLSITDFAYGYQGVAGFLAGVYKKKNFTPTLRAYAAAEKVEAWYSKKNPNKKAIMQVVQGQLQRILQDILSTYEKQSVIYHTAEAVLRLIYSFGIITHLLASLRKYRTEKNVLLISDTANLLRQIIADNETPFVYEKIGSFYNHFLIDEFQDISAFQWQNLQPLIENSLAMGYMSLVVGDVKQSIYRWRGGQWQLLAKQLEQRFKDTKSVVLPYNWRSKPNIIKFNNTFFTQASRNLLRYFQQEIFQLKDTHLHDYLTNQLQELATVYAHIEQQVPPGKPEDPDLGYVEINWIANQTILNHQQDWKEQVKQQLPILLENLQDAGFKLQDMALLVRNHVEGKELFQLLLAYQHSPAAKPGYSYMTLSDVSLALANSPWVNILISALQHVAHPEDQLAKAELIYLYQVYVGHHAKNIDHHFWYKALSDYTDGLLPVAFIDAYTELRTLPLYERLDKIIDTLQLISTTSQPFIQVFQDIVLAYLQARGRDINFLTWWHEKKHQHMLPHMERQDAISIMTIHQSKGLEFKVVIIPFCNWYLDHNISKTPTLWCFTDTPPFDTFLRLPVRYHPKLANTLYAKYYYQERMQVYMDHLNLLYVAFTRAEHRLYIFTPEITQATCHTTGDLIYQTVRQPSTLPHEHASLHWEDYWREHENKLVIE